MSTTPPSYDRQASFTSFQTPDAPTAGANLEAEFNRIKTSSDATQARLAEIQRDDGLLRNESVHPDALSQAVRALLTITGGQIEGSWATGVSYDKGDVVSRDGSTYIAALAHLSGATFTVDLAAGKWLLVSGSAFASATSYGVVGDGVVDDATAFETFIDALQVSGRTGFVPAGTYRISFIRRRSLTKNLRIVCDPAAVFVGTSTKQDFAGAGQTSFTVTEFTPSANGFVVVHVASGGAQTVLVENTGYTVTGQLINTAAGSAPFGALSVGDTLRVVSANGMIELGANSLGGCEIDWIGGKIDASARGYAENTGSGSGIVFYNTRRGSCKDVYAYASDDWEAAIATGLGGDSGITTLSCDNFEIAGCLLVGWGDLGVYATGGASAGESDDGYGVDIHNCGFVKCQSAASVKRGGQASHIHHCWARECNIGFSFYPTGNSSDGGRGSIHDNFGLRIGRIFVDCRATKGVVVHDNTCIDIGYAPDGVTARTTPSAFQFLGVEDGQMHDNVVRLDAWAQNNQRGIVFGQESGFGGQTVDSTAHHNKIVGLSVGMIESGAGTNNAFLDNEILSCATPVSAILSTSRCSYWDGTTRRSNVGATLQAESGTYTPTLTNTSNITASTPYPAQWMRVGRVVTVSGRIEVTAAANSTGTELRVSLPIAPTFANLGECAGVASFGDVQAGGADVKIRGQVGGANARFNYTSGTSAVASREMTFTLTYVIP